MVEFEDYSAKVNAVLDDACVVFLYEAAGEIEAQAKRNTRVGTGQLKNSWTYVVDEDEGEATIGSPLQNSIWEEFGTGEHAANGDGRKDVPWTYKDEVTGKWYTTTGKTPNRALQKAFETTKAVIKRRAEQVLKGRLK